MRVNYLSILKRKLDKSLPINLGISFLLVGSLSLSAQKSSDSKPVKGMNSYCKTPNGNQRVIDGNLTPQDGSGVLGNYLTLTKCGLDFTTASQVLGQRLSPAGIPQPAPFVISGIPTTPCIVIERAILYCDASGDGTAITATVNGPLGSANYPMTMIGSGPDKCWGFTGTYSYRADVTASVNGNGTYNISGLPVGASVNDVDGATLFVIWSDGSQSYQGTMQLDDGCIEVSGGNTSYDMSFPAICGTPTNGKAFFLIGDIQTNPTSWTANSTPVPLTWAWWNYLEVPSTYTVGQTLSNYTVSTSGDCYNLMVTGTYYQTSCTTCTASTLAVTSSSTVATCSACDGTATATPTPAGTYTYSWSPGGQTTQTATNLCPGTYTCTVTGTCLSGTTTVTVGNSGSLNATSVDANPTCFGGTGSSTVTPSGGVGPYTYSWAPSGGTGATATGLSAGTYSCTVTDANGCSTVQIVTITQPTALTTLTTSDSVCSGTLGLITATPSGGVGPYTYAWSNGPTTASQNVSVTTSTTYTVTITDSNGCTTTGTSTIALVANPTVSISSNATNGALQLTNGVGQLCFTNNTPGAVVSVWDLNGVPNFQQNPCVNVTMADSGMYCAKLFVTNSSGCMDSSEVCILIGETSYSIPNVFTPNGDGTNDAFVISNRGMKTLTCEIYDRWGELIYEWNGTTGSWDGKTKNGNEAVDGVYYYTAHLTDFSEKKYEESGFVQLIRGKK